MTPPANPARTWPPDAFAALALLAAVLLEWLVPMGLLPRASLASPATWAGAFLIIAGFGIEIAAARALARAGTSARPNAAPTALATAGPFARSRNPFYCGLLLLIAGLFVALGLDWGVILVPLLWLALDRTVIPAEEARLEAAFGDAYRAYAARTRRWL